MALARACGATLRVLSVGWLSFDAAAFESMCAHLPALQQLDVSGCREAFTNESALALARHCPNLEVLDASDCYGLTDVGSHCILTMMPRLVHVCLSRCHRITVDAMQDLAHKPTLKRLDLYGCYPSVLQQILVCWYEGMGVRGEGNAQIFVCVYVCACMCECVSFSLPPSLSLSLSLPLPVNPVCMCCSTDCVVHWRLCSDRRGFAASSLPCRRF